MKYYIKFLLEFLFLFLLNFAFSLIITTNCFDENLSSIIYVLSSFAFFIYFATQNIGIRKILWITAVISLGIILGLIFSPFGDNLLWVTDSINMHVPGTHRLLKMLMGEEVSFINLYDRTYLTYFFVSPFFALFGASQVSSALGLLIPRLFTVLLIYKTTKLIIKEHEAKVASLIFAFSPITLFYSLAFYKEATVQMLVILCIYLMLKIETKFSWKCLAALVISLVLLGYERHYLFPCMILCLVSLALLSSKAPNYLKFSAIGFSILSYFAFKLYYWDIGFDNLIRSLQSYRQLYRDNYPDVSPINYQLPYIVAVGKLFFSPIFTPGKMKLFSNFSHLITWGSFFNQVVHISFIIGMYKLVKENYKRFIPIIAPLALLLLIFGYVAPYNGRLKDSFFPVIAIISSPQILWLLIKIKLGVQSNKNY